MAKNHAETVKALYWLIEDLIDLEIDLLERSGQHEVAEAVGKALGGHTLSLAGFDAVQASTALDDWKDGYPSDLVALVDGYWKAKGGRKGSFAHDTAMRLIHMSWLVVLGLRTPRQACTFAGLWCGAEPRASDVEAALKVKRGKKPSDELRVKRVYVALSAAANVPFHDGRSAREPSQASRRLSNDLGEMIRAFDPEQIRHGEELRARAEREGKSIGDVINDIDAERQPRSWKARIGAEEDGSRRVVGLDPDCDDNESRNVTVDGGISAERCPTRPGSLPTRRPPATSSS